MSLPHQKGGNIVWTGMKYHIDEENDQYKAIGLCGFDYRSVKEYEGGGTREGLDRYPYLKHLIQL